MTMPASPPEDILRIQKLCDEVLAPLYDLQTSRVRVVAIDGPVGQVRLEGACASCIASTRLLFAEIEVLLKYHKDSVEYLEVVV